MNFQNQSQKRPRAPRMIWTDQKCLELLDLVQKEVDDNPGGFEKPNIKQFYLKIIQNSEKFEGIKYTVLTNKIRAYQRQYNMAISWAQNRQLDLSLAEEQNPKAWYYLNSTYKYFSKLHQLFGKGKNLEEEDFPLETLDCGSSVFSEPFRRGEDTNIDFGIKRNGKINPNEFEKFKWEKELETKKTIKQMDYQHTLNMKKLEDEKVLKLYEMTLKYQYSK